MNEERNAFEPKNTNIAQPMWRYLYVSMAKKNSKNPIYREIKYRESFMRLPNDIERLQNCSFKSFLQDFQGFFSAVFSTNLIIGLFFGCFSSGQLGKEDSYSLFYCYWKSEVIRESFKDLKFCRWIFSSLHIKRLCNSKQKIKRKARKRKILYWEIWLF